MKTSSCDLLIVGAGPAGLRAGLVASKNRKVTYLDISKYGKRINVSGNGRANFFNLSLLKEETYSYYPFSRVKNIVLSKDGNRAEKFFSFLTKERNFPYRASGDSCYPYFNRSECLDHFLIETLKQKEIPFLQGRRSNIRGNTLTYQAERKDRYQLSFHDALIALGGDSYDRKEKGNDDFLASLGLKRTPFKSCLCPLKVSDPIPSYLVNQRLKAKVTLLCKEEVLYEETGEILFKPDGLSGICIFNCSLYLRHALEKNSREDRSIKVDYLPDRKNSRIPLDSYPLFRKRYFKDRKRKQGTPFVFHLKGFYPFKESQVSFGGVSLSEINPATRQLISNPHLYRAGERLSPAFPCGGYNRGLAFTEGYIAGKALIHE